MDEYFDLISFAIYNISFKSDDGFTIFFITQLNHYKWKWRLLLTLVQVSKITH